MDTISSYRDNRPTNTQTDAARPPVANTRTGPITIHCVAELSAQCNNDQRLLVVSFLSFCLSWLARLAI